MATRDPRVDTYIAEAPEFARPILEWLRAQVHKSCPEVVETIKWRMPSFEHHGILCGMAAFKAHCVFGFWKHELVLGAFDAKAREAMGSFGCLKSKTDLPPAREFAAALRKAVELNEQGVSVPRQKRTKRPAGMPKELRAALATNARARASFEGFPPSHQREYIEWIAEAKRAETRAKRLATALEWLSEGKPRNWKYMPQAKVAAKTSAQPKATARTTKKRTAKGNAKARAAR